MKTEIEQMSLEDYHSKLEAMDDDVREIVLEVWDWTGRPTTEHPVTVALCLLMDTIVTPESFRIKGRQITDDVKEMTDDDFDAIYYTYERGMIRIRTELEKDSA